MSAVGSAPEAGAATYRPHDDRHARMPYRRCGASGLKLPAISLGLWHSFGADADPANARALVLRAVDLGITHFDLANNYGPPPGSAEQTLGRILGRDLAAHRDELFISTKAGYVMAPGPYGQGGSRKHLLDSLDQSLRRLGLDHVDLYYHHRPDPETPLAETLAALDHAVRSGKARYVGVSNYPAALLREAVAGLRALGTPCSVHQPRYSLLDRRAESEGLLDALRDTGVGCIAFSPLAQGLLSARYLGGDIPADSRAAQGRFLKPGDLTVERLAVLRALNAIAQDRGQTLAQMALAWVLRDGVVSSALLGASRVAQIDEAVRALDAGGFSAGELAAIDAVLAGS